MQVTVTFRHMESSEPLRKYAAEKSERLVRYLFEPIEIHWALSVEKIRHIADATITANGVTVKANESTSDMYAAIDLALEKLEAQVRKHKEKVKDHKPHTTEPPGKTMPTAERAERPAHGIVKKENQFLKPMSVEEAAMQMSVVDNDFLVFTDSKSHNVSVIYRTGDGEYGLIETQTK